MNDPETPDEVVAAGTVPWRRAGDGIEFLLVHRPRYDDWSLPKGHQDPDEPLTATAVRETLEEAGVTVRIGGRLGHTSYRTPDGTPKAVHYWAAEVVADHGFTPNSETDERRWVPARDAAALLSYAHDAELVERLDAVGVPESTVLFVRHAKAGNREDWEGDDDLRPLSGTGNTQADRLAEFLPRFGPDRVSTAPPLRCGQTVEPLTAKLGLEVSVEPLMGEHDYWDDPDSGRARFRELASVPGVTVVSSQGGVIPDVVEALLIAEQHGSRGTVAVPDDGVPSHKASTWVLGFAGDGEMLFADYYRRPPG
ncbi:NUDIX hydrolase [Pseudonocardia endophytica]|uniref:8-oxo-dGTP diphosphatase n=1 Tax=Pseudonocardia endophytica TaxID=401976 RepID=A0A4R1HKQ7_PSEEN|nr:bifunctional NUDIX hydrolase/histidine phosphatase family protein [Pseudonocardia endophytica]TCK20870.1 8-oxo-dGTP diphosphatase [Pseudonocardia endophytica]